MVADSRSSPPVETGGAELKLHASPRALAGGKLKLRLSLLPALLVAAAIVLATVLAVASTYRQRARQEGARIETIAGLTAAQIAVWLQDLDRETQFIRGSEFFANLYLRSQVAGDAASGSKLLQRLIEYRTFHDFKSTLVVDERGTVALSEFSAQRDIAPALKTTALQAMASRNVLHTDLYASGESDLPVRIDFVAPLVLSGNPASGTIVMR